MELLRAVAGGDAGPERGVRIHPLAGRRARQQLQEDLEVGEARHELLDPDDRHEHGRQRRAHAAVSLRLDDAERPGLGDGEVGAADRHPRVQELLAQVEPGRLGELARVVGDARGRRSSAGRGRGSRVRLRWIAGTRMCDDQSPSSWRISSAKSVSIARDPAGGERGVETDLVGRQRLDLDELADAVGGGRPRARSAFASAASRAQCTVAPAALDRRLELEQVLVEVGEHVGLDRPARLAQLLPVGELGDDPRALLADRVGGGPQVRAQPARRRAPRRRPPGTARIALIRPRRGSRPGAAARTPGRSRASLPPIWSRQEASSAVQTLGSGRDDRPALVVQHRGRGLGVLEREGAAEAAAFLGGRQLEQLEAVDLREQRERRVADAGDAQGVTGRVVGDPAREATPRARHPEPVHEQLRELEDPRRELVDASLQLVVAGLAGELGVDRPAPSRRRRRTAPRPPRSRRRRGRSAARAPSPRRR